MPEGKFAHHPQRDQPASTVPPQSSHSSLLNLPSHSIIFLIPLREDISLVKQEELNKRFQVQISMVLFCFVSYK